MTKKMVTIEKLEALKDGADDLHKRVINDLIRYSTDGSETYSYMSDILQHGCVSGIVGRLVYYKDTVAFYEQYESDIWDLLENTRQSLGDKTILQTIAGLNGAENVGSGDQFKNLLAWFAYEETIHVIADELGLEL